MRRYAAMGVLLVLAAASSMAQGPKRVRADTLVAEVATRTDTILFTGTSAKIWTDANGNIVIADSAYPMGFMLKMLGPFYMTGPGFWRADGQWIVLWDTTKMVAWGNSVIGAMGNGLVIANNWGDVINGWTPYVPWAGLDTNAILSAIGEGGFGDIIGSGTARRFAMFSGLKVITNGPLSWRDPEESIIYDVQTVYPRFVMRHLDGGDSVYFGMDQVSKELYFWDPKSGYRRLSQLAGPWDSLDVNLWGTTGKWLRVQDGVFDVKNSDIVLDATSSIYAGETGGKVRANYIGQRPYDSTAAAPGYILIIGPNGGFVLMDTTGHFGGGGGADAAKLDSVVTKDFTFYGVKTFTGQTTFKSPVGLGDNNYPYGSSGILGFFHEDAADELTFLVPILGGSQTLRLPRTGRGYDTLATLFDAREAAWLITKPIATAPTQTNDALVYDAPKDSFVVKQAVVKEDSNQVFQTPAATNQKIVTAGDSTHHKVIVNEPSVSSEVLKYQSPTGDVAWGRLDTNEVDNLTAALGTKLDTNKTVPLDTTNRGEAAASAAGGTYYKVTILSNGDAGIRPDPGGMDTTFVSIFGVVGFDGMSTRLAVYMPGFDESAIYIMTVRYTGGVSPPDKISAEAKTDSLIIRRDVALTNNLGVNYNGILP